MRGLNRGFFNNGDSDTGILPSENFIQTNANYGSLHLAFSSFFTGKEINYVVKIPETNNALTDVRFTQITKQVGTLDWTYSGNTDALDHFVVYEVLESRKVPIGARVASKMKFNYNFHIINAISDEDRSYLIEAYNESGQLVTSIESEEYSSPLIVSSLITKKISWK